MTGTEFSVRIMRGDRCHWPETNFETYDNPEDAIAEGERYLAWRTNLSPTTTEMTIQLLERTPPVAPGPWKEVLR